MIGKLIEQAEGRISVIPGTGVRPDNLKQLIELTGATEFHASAKSVFKSEMIFKDVRTGNYQEEFLMEQTDANLVKELVQIVGNIT